MSSPGTPAAAQTVPVRVQVIDLHPRVVDVVVAAYLPASDLTQRIARDVGLGGWWEDGSRRGFALRARGRVLGPEERLVDVGVVPYELLHLLPEPRPGSPVQERPLGVELPDHVPPSRSTQVARTLLALVWAVLWAWLAAVGVGDRALALAGGLGLAWLCQGAVHGWLPQRGVMLPSVIAGAASSILSAPAMGFDLVAVLPSAREAWIHGALTFAGGCAGWLLGVLVWLGPTVGLTPPARATRAGAAAAAVVPTCGFCQGPVEVAVRLGCPHACGRIFHEGCYEARTRVATGPDCAMCGARVGG